MNGESDLVVDAEPELANTKRSDGWVSVLRDPLLWVTCAVSLLVYLVHGFGGRLIRDSGVYVYGGQRFADGVLPYVGLVNRAGPLAHVIPGLAILASRPLGVDDVIGVRVLFMLISVACVGLTYVVGRALFVSRAAGVASAAALLCFEGFIYYATFGPREKTAMVCFLLVALLAVIHQRWFTCGLFIALATLVWQPVFFGAIAGAVVAVLIGVPWRRWWRALLRIALGGVVPVAITVVVYAIPGQLRILVDDFLLINARYTSQASPLDDLGWAWDRMVHGYGVTVWLLLAGMVGLVALALVRAVRREGRHEPRSAAIMAFGVCTVVSTIWTFKAFDNWPDAFVLLPMAALGVGGIVAALGALASQHKGKAVSIVAAGLVTVFALVAAFSYSIGHRENDLDAQRASVAAVLDLLPADASVLSVESPQDLVLERKVNPTRFQLYGNGMTDYIADTWPGGLAGYSRYVADQDATAIVVDGPVPPWLEPVLDGYRDVGSIDGQRWYLNRDTVSAETWREMRSARRGVER